MRRESPLAEALAGTLRGEIAEGRLTAGKPLPSERELAERFTVSRTMVRQALSLLAKQGWLRVLPHCRPVVALPEELHGTRTKPDHISVWLWPFVDDFAVSSIFRGIQKGLHGAPLRLVVATAGSGSWSEVLLSERRFLQDVADDPLCAGAVVWLLGGELSLEPLHRVAGQHVPLVFVDRQPPNGVMADFVGTENVGSAQRVVQKLISLGHRHIACVTNMDEVSTVAGRLLGYRRAMDDAGLQDRVYRFDVRPGENESDSADRLIQGMADHLPTAVFAINDSIALQLIDSFERAGYPVPSAVSVAGFDGLLRWLPDGGRLTTADQDFFRMGQLAAELLIERFEGDEPRTHRHILLDAPLRVQGSTAPPSQDIAISRKTKTEQEILP